MSDSITFRCGFGSPACDHEQGTLSYLLHQSINQTSIAPISVLRDVNGGPVGGNSSMISDVKPIIYIFFFTSRMSIQSFTTLVGKRFKSYDLHLTSNICNICTVDCKQEWALCIFSWKMRDKGNLVKSNWDTGRPRTD